MRMPAPTRATFRPWDRSLWLLVRRAIRMRLRWSDPFVQVTAFRIIQKTLNEPRLIP